MTAQLPLVGSGGVVNDNDGTVKIPNSPTIGRRKSSRPESSSSLEAKAASSLAVLLREDPLLTKHNMHLNVSANCDKDDDGNDKNEKLMKGSDDDIDIKNGTKTEASFSYAAALLLANNDSVGRSIRDHQKQAEDALGEVDRKLALIESLAERVSRTSPEAVAGPLLRLHGYAVATIEEGDSDEYDAEKNTNDEADIESFNNSAKTATLVATRERCDRLKRQGEVLEGIAARVETSLTRGLTKMEEATNRLSRVLQLSATLKMILRLQFEASKLENFMLDDLRDLTRAAASVAVIEDLLSKPELQLQKKNDYDDNKILIVESIRPQAIKTAAAVREAAAALLKQQQQDNRNSVTSSSSIVQLGTTLQVYYHLGELPEAAWSAVNHALMAAEKATNIFWSPTTLTNLQESATSEAKISASSKKISDANVQRALKNKLKEFRSRAATTWADDIYHATLQVWNLQQVLERKSDPVTRQVFRDVVAAATVPEKFRLSLSNDSSEGHIDDNSGTENKVWSIFTLYWDRLCQRMGERLKHIIMYENGKFSQDVAALYPTTRSAVLNMLASLQDTMQAARLSGSTFAASLDDASVPSTSSSNMGVLGGSTALNDPFLQWISHVAVDDFGSGTNTSTTGVVGNIQGGLTNMGADSWTVVKNRDADGFGIDGSTSTTAIGSSTSTSMSAVFNSPEWLSMQGNHASQKGLFRMQMTFLNSSSDRLCASLEYMFTQDVTIDDMGNAISQLPLLPSKYDIQRLDNIIRQELAMADPREGGGELSAVTMIAENVVQMINKFCTQAENGLSKVGESGCLSVDGSPTDALVHDMKVTKIMFFMSECLKDAPEKVFLDPYRPAVTNQLEEASNISMLALLPARKEIDKMVNRLVVYPLYRALNIRLAQIIGLMHKEGAYLYQGSNRTSSHNMDNSVVSQTSSFVQKHLSQFYDDLQTTFFQKLPPPYSLAVASAISIFSIYTFVSTASLIRPMKEDAKMQLTQDLADFELVLDQFITRTCGNSTTTLRTIGNGKPYAELRAVRQMLFWTGLDDKTKTAASIAKNLSREAWVRDIRPSTVCHYLFSFGPDILSSPHHWKKLRVEEYVTTLVSLDGEIDEGESLDWMTTMACCDSFKQRESAQSSSVASEEMEGDSRVAAILMAIGPELLQRRRS